MPDDMPPPAQRPALQTLLDAALGPRRAQTWAIALICGAVVLAMLYLARTFLIPLAIATFLFSLLAAAIDRLERLHIGPVRLPPAAASAAALLALAAALFLAFTLAVSQVNTLIEVGPGYLARAEATLAALAADFGDETAEGLVTAFRDLRAADQLRALGGAAGSTMVSATLVTLYVGFMLAERPHLRRKLRRMAPAPEDAARLDAVIRSIARSVQRYILIKALVSAATGLVAYAILSAAGVELADTLAIVTFILNFIPNIGSIAATVAAGVVIVVQFDDWTSIVGIIGALGAMQFVVGQVLEPLLMGRTLRLSPFAILLSLVFWGLVWGVAGMFLAVPITVTALIACSHVAALRPVAVMLSADGDLPEDALGAARRSRSAADPRPTDA